MLFFWLLTGLFLLPLLIGLPWLWSVGYLFAFYLAAVFLIPLFTCRHCPNWDNGKWYLTCSAHYGIPKVYRYNPNPLNAVQRLLVYVGFVVIYGAGVIILLLSGESKLAVVCAFNSVVWVVVMRKTHCAKCVHATCPMNTNPALQCGCGSWGDHGRTLTTSCVHHPEG